MTTPHQGPGMWQQGNRDQALDWLANLDARQQQALQRAMNTHQALGPIYNAANRVREIASRTAERLSEGAKSLASQAGQFADNTRARTTGAFQSGRQATTEFSRQAAVKADLATQSAAERVGEAGRAVKQTAQNAGKAVVAGAQQAGQTVVSGAQTAGRAIADTTKETAGKVSRWFQERVSNTNNRANAARAAFSAFRQDPTLNQTGMTGKDMLAISAAANQLVNAADEKARQDAAAALIQAAQNLQSPQTGNQVNPNWVTAGQAPASAAVKPSEAAQQNPHGQASQTGGQQKGSKGPDLTK